VAPAFEPRRLYTSLPAVEALSQRAPVLSSFYSAFAEADHLVTSDIDNMMYLTFEHAPTIDARHLQPAARPAVPHSSLDALVEQLPEGSETLGALRDLFPGSHFQSFLDQACPSPPSVPPPSLQSSSATAASTLAEPPTTAPEPRSCPELHHNLVLLLDLQLQHYLDTPMSIRQPAVQKLGDSLSKLILLASPNSLASPRAIRSARSPLM
jgi:hypothetical protein